MFEISVYYNDVLRYTIVANWDKVQELRNNGFDVQAKEASIEGSGLGRLRSPRTLQVNGGSDAIIQYDNGYDLQNWFA